MLAWIFGDCHEDALFIVPYPAANEKEFFLEFTTNQKSD